MKKILFILLLLFSVSSFAQNRFHYTIKLDSVTPVQKDAVTWLNGMFGTYPTFNDSTGCFDFYSNFDISQELFTQKAWDRQYNVSYFTKAKILIAVPRKEEEIR